MKCFCAGTRRIARLLTRRYEEALRPANVTPTQFELLGVVSSQSSLSQWELAHILSLDQTTLSRNLKVLIGREWITQRASSEDSRRVVYAVSGKGRAAFRRAFPLWQRAQEAMEQSLGSESASVWSTIDRLTGVLQRDQTAE